MFYSIFKENVQGQKHPRRYIVAEPELPSFGKPKCAVQNESNGSYNHHDDLALYKGISS